MAVVEVAVFREVEGHSSKGTGSLLVSRIGKVATVAVAVAVATTRITGTVALSASRRNYLTV
jgi:hypothetical protein